MKHSVFFAFSLIVTLSIIACSPSENSFSSEKTKSSSNCISSSKDVLSASNYSSSRSSFPEYSYAFDNKESGLTLDQINEEITKINPEPQERRKVRYTWHIVEKLTGVYPKMMLDDTQMPEGEIVGDFVSEPRNNNLDTNIKIISGTPVTQMQQYYARNYSSSITPSGWLGYHSQRRQFLERAQEGEGFEERFYTGPLTLWMRIWGRRPENAQMDGVFFCYEEFERAYNEAGYCISLKIKEYTYIKGTMTSFMNGSVDYDGSYEYSLTCGIEYLEE